MGAELIAQPMVKWVVKRHARRVTMEHVRIVKDAAAAAGRPAASSSTAPGEKKRIIIPTPSMGRMAIRSAQFGMMLAVFDTLLQAWAKT